jgi:dTDP-4-amino-4,6-dideoxygalactose transaminase
MNSINVTEPFLPPLEEYIDYLKGIWDRNVLTNQGPLVRELEQSIQAYHLVDMPVHCVTNGGLGLQIMLKALGVKGEVITTPFSYVATASCPLWEGCSVKFADIEPDYLTIDPVAVEAAIGPDTVAILATHVFGNPCDCEALEAIASKHGLALIFDAAHAFGVRYKDKSILEYGDASMVSLHATKLLHAVEGGFVAAKDPAVAEKVEWMRRFGHNGSEEFHGVGINAKMSELHGAMGLCNLKYVQDILEKRKAVCLTYDQYFSSMAAGGLRPFAYRQESSQNYAYYPVTYNSESSLLQAVARLNEANIFPRRYFYPSLSSCFGDEHEGCPLAMDISRRILCLPLSSEMQQQDVKLVAETLLKGSQ